MVCLIHNDAHKIGCTSEKGESTFVFIT